MALIINSISLIINSISLIINAISLINNSIAQNWLNFLCVRCMPLSVLPVITSPYSGQLYRVNNTDSIELTCTSSSYPVALLSWVDSENATLQNGSTTTLLQSLRKFTSYTKQGISITHCGEVDKIVLLDSMFIHSALLAEKGSTRLKCSPIAVPTAKCMQWIVCIEQSATFESVVRQLLQLNPLEHMFFVNSLPLMVTISELLLTAFHQYYNMGACNTEYPEWPNFPD